MITTFSAESMQIDAEIFDTSFKVSCKFAMLRESMHKSDKGMLPACHLDTLVTIFLYCIPESYHIWFIYWRNALEVAQKTSIAWSSNKLVSAFKDTRMTYGQDFWEKKTQYPNNLQWHVGIVLNLGSSPWHTVLWAACVSPREIKQGSWVVS
jgi:hypothetical protein